MARATSFAPRTGGSYIGVRPSDKKLQGLYQKLREQTERRWLWLDEDEMVGRLNRLLRGWANYFCLGTVTKTYRRDRNELWQDYNCDEANNHVVIGKENYFLSGDGLLMPTKKDQPPPDLRYFKQTRK